mmetsp:Transcript_3845/g.3216  ORF Transcript_3845/g.3216 Transcript_3845/m.3216 type:complete len:243 (+) Transcript_3845:140-868(+)|eukprot:CAMPEP_0205801812 /NCGR_PEP_ID=MMETSP0205-20121125/3930_1 /ASSEMBLY_ACC=CAM_ASM_000278 /TAXON_ID=36767 /ORGANISM="Euplotes focardii, Strain TN1" /LENGTH=242 /DNA_ID=CAMNT_0053067193 /DNA_START=134 /DNA_END=862 /DNA_ORIENTATION=-
MWANFQNPHPNYIHYNLHREKHWKPLIFDKDFNKASGAKKKKKEDNSNDSESEESDDELVSKNQDTKADEEVEVNNDDDEYFHVKDKKKDKDTIEMFKEMGNYMRMFSPFYEIESMNKLYMPEDIKRKIDDIIMTIELGLKSVRSAQNKNTKLKKDRNTIKKFEIFLDILEDEAAGRYSGADLTKLKKLSLISLRKIMPLEYMLEIQPSFFNYFDSERIKTALLEQLGDWMTDTHSKLMFVI